MSITDELRGFMDGADGYELWCPRHKVELENIADHIDAAHRSALEKLAAQLDEGEDGWVRLPVDADGVPIHVGDRLTDGEYRFTVCELATFGDGSWSIRNEDGNAWAACDVTHHRAPTVEDVLREFADKVCSSDHIVQDGRYHGIEDTDLLTEYAAKLRLAGEGE